MKVPEKYRFRNTSHPMGSTTESGNNGVFVIPHNKIRHCYFQVIASDGEGWEHVSVILVSQKNLKRCPTWQEMCYIKDLFWEDDKTVVQYHPPKSEYVNNHPHCLHLWRPVGIELPLPDSILVGIK